MDTKPNTQKYAIAIWHSGQKGKTDSLRQFATALLKAYPAHTPHPRFSVVSPSQDFRLVTAVNGKVIVIETQGDPNTNLKARLEDLAVNYNCDLIVCSCRTRGETVAAVNNLKNHGFEIIWSSTYDVKGATSQSTVNAIKGIHILELLQGLKII